jgi:hypothetical protein
MKPKEEGEGQYSTGKQYAQWLGGSGGRSVVREEHRGEFTTGRHRCSRQRAIHG